MHEFEALSFTLTREHRLSVLENRMLRGEHLDLRETSIMTSEKIVEEIS
jgi:hypothetical protein